jgi:hypothetical protein
MAYAEKTLHVKAYYGICFIVRDDILQRMSSLILLRLLSPGIKIAAIMALAKMGI